MKIPSNLKISLSSKPGSCRSCLWQTEVELIIHTEHYYVTQCIQAEQKHRPLGWELQIIVYHIWDNVFYCLLYVIPVFPTCLKESDNYIPLCVLFLCLTSRRQSGSSLQLQLSLSLSNYFTKMVHIFILPCEVAGGVCNSETLTSVCL